MEPFLPSHIPAVAVYMRPSDREETRAAFGAEPFQALIRSTRASTLKWSIFSSGRPIGIFGVGAASMLSDHGSPWLLGTPALEDIGLTFLRQSREYVGRMLAQHSFLENWVDARNLTSIKWLKWCGFRFDDPAPFGLEGRDFLRFYMERGQACANP